MNRRGAEDAEEKMDLNKLSESVIGAAIDVHKETGAGLLESTSEQCFCRELSLRGLRFECQKQMPITYKGMKLDCGYRIDVLVEGVLVVEIKAVEKLKLETIALVPE